MELVLSIFPGADLLGRAFEELGFCVVRGPDLVWGGDMRRFHPPRGRFSGVIGGSPCQDFSKARRTAPTGEGLELLGHFGRAVAEAEPDWFLLENVPAVPSIAVPGYVVQRFNLNASECGARQNRLRAFQFGSRSGACLVIERREVPELVAPCCMAREAARTDRRAFPDFCELQGLPRDFDLPGLSLGAKYKAVGNGVPLQMGRVIACAVAERAPAGTVNLCACNCGRRVLGTQTRATPACRKRLERARRVSSIAGEGFGVTPAATPKTTRPACRSVSASRLGRGGGGGAPPWR